MHGSRLILYANRLRERLWFKPMVYCLAAVASVFAAQLADLAGPVPGVPHVSPDMIEGLLGIISSTMLAVATFAVGAMVSAYAHAGSSATPRAFRLVLADDLSQTALSSFVGAFIFAIVSTIAVQTGAYEQTGLFALFVLTLALFTWVILTFVRWVDTIARLGRVGSTIEKAEAATRRCLDDRRRRPCLGGRDAADARDPGAAAIAAGRVGYVQYIDMESLQEAAEAADIRIVVAAAPGAFVAADRPLARVTGRPDDDLRDRIARAFLVGSERTFEADPRFGLLVLSETAQRALSPGINDPGTAIAIIGSFVRLFTAWVAPQEADPPDFDRVFVPALDLADLFDDAFNGIARDGAGTVEVGIRLQKAFASISAAGDTAVRAEARRHAALALQRAEQAITFADDLVRLRAAARGA